jgi:triosephosphate isomerase (TIM)
MRKVFIGGNWKCNNTLAQTQQMITNVVDILEFDDTKVDVIVAPIYLHLVTVMFTKKQPNVQVAAQNCAVNTFGAFTGEIAAEQIKDINICWVIVGHSERRTHHGEDDKVVS